MKSSVYGLTAQAVALAATFGLSLSGPHRASAQATVPVAQSDNGPAITILSPTPRTTFSGIKPVEISAFYQGSSTNQIALIELYVDGVKAAQKVLDTPETRGVVSFLVDAGALSGGTHRIVVRASAADAEVASAKSSFLFTVPTPEQPMLPAVPSAGPSQGSPLLSIENPASDGQVQGKVTLRIKASDPSGKLPYVSLFIDHNFKTLRNYAPYEFSWDTTQYPNGYHTIEAFGYNDTQDVGHAQPMRVYVNNPGGRTDRRTDLQDAPKAHIAKPVTTHKVADVAPMPVRSVAAKATPVRRRPTPAVLAQTAKAPIQMASTPKLSHQMLTLTGTAGLSSPFVAETARPRLVTPTHNFKPLRPSTSVTKESPALLAMAPAAAAHTPNALLAAVAALPAGAFANQYLTAPAMPTLHASVKAVSVTPTVRTVRISLPSHIQRVVTPHAPKVASQMQWLRAAGERTLMFNSSRLPLERPLVAEGSVMFGPLRQIFEAGGGSLMWQARTGTVTAHTATKDIALTMGSQTALINQKPVMLDGVPYINNGRTMIPLSFLQSALNVTVHYDAATGHLQIDSNK
jgi:hypothetical protein